MKISFIGLGTMGRPMATHLLRAGYDVMVYNRSRESSLKLAEAGASVASSPKEATQHSDIVITMLSNDRAVEEVILGENGVLAGAKAGQIVMDCSTISPKTSQKLADQLAGIGVDMLDAPVTGSEPQAIEGILTFMVGGKKEIYEKCLPLFEVMGKASFYMGKSGAGSYIKLANNTMAAINLLSLSESIVMAAKAGIDPELFVQVVNGGGARSGMVDTKSPKMINRDFHPNFATELMHKDLTLAVDIAADMNIPVPVLSLVRQMLQMGMSKGYSKEDVCSVVKLYEEWANVEVKKHDQKNL
ncbi:NAD(P)-dependent oxidoreductase [Ammoniphilus sp. YIM 78166]|uniref:NAD(P)-dependent oxidoreductase n=1 Tax=Ammoniphilus sp. YIM 78166 TaxID=1644106 RepID=UPI001F0F98E7|nr:NAD(P)-dependent oxidoreductase [Ammoniphilus sp. YIM 78166]